MQSLAVYLIILPFSDQVSLSMGRCDEGQTSDLNYTIARGFMRGTSLRNLNNFGWLLEISPEGGNNGFSCGGWQKVRSEKSAK